MAAQALQSQLEAMSRKIQNDQAVIEQLTYKIALLKGLKFAKRSEQISPAQKNLLDGAALDQRLVRGRTPSAEYE